MERETLLAWKQELTEQKAVYLEQYHAGILDKEQFQQKRNEILQIMRFFK